MQILLKIWGRGATGSFFCGKDPPISSAVSFLSQFIPSSSHWGFPLPLPFSPGTSRIFSNFLPPVFHLFHLKSPSAPLPISHRAAQSSQLPFPSVSSLTGRGGSYCFSFSLGRPKGLYNCDDFSVFKNF